MGNGHAEDLLALEAASNAARLAGLHILNNLGKLQSADIGLKKASDFVTRVDRESEEIIVSALRDSFPDYGFLAEESMRDEATESGARWIIDPLDGTTNYIHSYPMFAVSIALEKKGDIVAGAVLDPLRDELFTALKGEGAYLGNRRLKVSGRTDLADCLVSTGFPFRQKHMLDRYMEMFSKVMEHVSDIRRAGAAALDFAHLAAGRCDGFFELGLSPWDIAAGGLLISEAGGIITDFGGGGEFLDTGNVLAGVPALHPVLLREAGTVFAGVVER
jgi:myo-inositol-1(or 4)-monophosphatase